MAQQQTRIYTIEAPNGEVFDIEGPADATDEQILAFAKSALDTKFPDNDFKDPVKGPDKEVDYGAALHAGVGDIAEGFGDLVGLFGNPVGAGLNWLTGTNNFPTDYGQVFRGWTGAPDGNEYASAINQAGSTALTGAGLANIARPLAMGTTERVLSSLAESPVRQTVAGMTGGASTQAAEDSGLGPLGQMAAGILGGGLGYGISGLTPKPKVASDLANAASDIGVDILPADAGGPVIRGLTAAGRQAIFSDQPISAGVARATEQTAAARSRAANLAGTPMDKGDAGDVVRKGAELYSKRTSQTGSQLYSAAEKAAGDTRLPVPKALAEIDRQIAELEAAPGGGGALLGQLRKMREDYSGAYSVQGIRIARTRAREEAEFTGLRGSDLNRRYKMIEDALSQDIAEGLQSSGKEGAARLYTRADTFWRERAEQIDNILEPLLGRNSPKSGEQVFSALERMANKESGDANRLAGLMRSLPEKEAQTVRATFIERLGLAKPGRQDETGEVFSFNEFGTRWNSMSDRAKAVMFPPESRKILDKVAKVALNAKATAAYQNSSNTGRAITGQALVSGGFGLLDLSTLFAASGAQYITGRLLASPRFAKWLARVPANPKAQKVHYDQLAQIAAREPLIANDIAQIQDYLAGASRASAAGSEEQQQDGR